jgi:hypothetical protein
MRDPVLKPDDDVVVSVPIGIGNQFLNFAQQVGGSDPYNGKPPYRVAL